MVIGSKPDGNALENLFLHLGRVGSARTGAFCLASPLNVTPHEFLLGLFPPSYQVCRIFASRVEQLND
jgi:hypothetical protein